jgi:hypothetical protein
MKDGIKSSLEWHKRYDNIDGTGDILFGFMLLGFSLLGHLQAVLPEGTWRHGPFGTLLFMYGVLIPVMGLGFWIRRIIKRHITWPRTGYVAGYSLWRRTSESEPAGGQAAAGVPSQKAMWAAMLALALVAALVAAGVACLMALARRHQEASLARAAFVALWVALYAFWVSRMDTHPWKWAMVLFMAMGLLAIDLIVPGGFIDLSRSDTGFIGLVWLASGGITLLWYIRRTKRPADGTP